MKEAWESEGVGGASWDTSKVGSSLARQKQIQRLHKNAFPGGRRALNGLRRKQRWHISIGLQYISTLTFTFKSWPALYFRCCVCCTGPHLHTRWDLLCCQLGALFKSLSRYRHLSSRDSHQLQKRKRLPLRQITHILRHFDTNCELGREDRS